MFIPLSIQNKCRLQNQQAWKIPHITAEIGRKSSDGAAVSFVVEFGSGGIDATLGACGGGYSGNANRSDATKVPRKVVLSVSLFDSTLY